MSFDKPASEDRRPTNAAGRRKRASTVNTNNIKMSLNMDPKELKVLQDISNENNDDQIRRHLIDKYNSYYRHWKDLNILVALFALITLFLSIYQWESEFSLRGANGR